MTRHRFGRSAPRHHSVPAMARVAFAAFAFCAFETAVSNANAQSLQAIYDAAHAYDAAYLGARAVAESAQYRVDQVHSLRRPSLGLVVTGGRTVSDAPVSDTRNRAATGAFTAVQPLFNRANDATIAQADRSLDSARADLELAEQELIVRVAQDYFDVLGAQDTLATTRANKRAIAQQRSAAQRNFEVGTATITDVREAQARFDLATSQDIAADNDLTTKRVALDELIGQRGVEPWRLITPVKLPSLMPNLVDEWVAVSDTSPNVRKAIAASDIATLETEKARAQHLPTIELDGTYSVGRGRLVGMQALSSSGQSLGGAFPIDVAGRTTNASLNVLLRLPLFAGFAVQNRIRETLLLEDQARFGLQAARRITAQQTRQAFFGVQSLLAQAAALEAAESSSRSALDATLLGYRVGVRVNIDVLNAQSQLYTTQRDLAQSRYAVLVNRLKLAQAAGSLAAADLSAVNQLMTQASLEPTSDIETAEPLAAALIPPRFESAQTAPVPASRPAPERGVATPQTNAAEVPETPEQQAADEVAAAMLARWTAAWSQRDVDGYAALYQPDFAGKAGSHARWIAFRRARIEGKHQIEVKASSVQVTPQPGSIVLRFQQSYQGDALRETSRKQITLKQEGDRWLISDEIELH